MSKSKDPDETYKERCFMRAQAVRRNPQYLLEWEAAYESYQAIRQKEIEDLFGSFGESDCDVFSFEDSELAQKLAHRWNLIVALHPDDSDWHLDGNVYPAVRAVNVFPYKECIFHDLFPHGFNVDYTPHLRDKQYLNLEIDLAKPKAQIMAEINTEIEHYLPFALSGKKKKVRGKAIDNLCWRVWDMHQKEGKSLLSIAKIIYPHIKDEDPNVDPELKALYEKIRAAYQKAVDLINASTPSPL